MRNLEKVGWAGWCPRRGRNAAKVNTGRACTRADRVCGVSQGWRVWWRMRVCGRQYGTPYTLPFPCPFVTRTRPSAPPRAPTRAYTRARARTGVPGWYWRAHVFAERKEKYGAGLLRGAAGKTSGFTARINSGSSGSRARQQHGNSRAGPLCLSPLEPLVLIIN